MGNATVAGSAKPRAGSWNLGAAQLSRRHVGDGAEEIRPLDEVAVDDVVASTPWRTFRWYAGQQHYSGTYWAATESDHVIYESRLELARLLFADFDVGVQRIAAQPFLLSCSVGGKERRHIPDYLLLTNAGPVIVDVKPRRQLASKTVAFTFEWTRSVLTARGWRYEVWSEPPPIELENVRFLAGYRRAWFFDPDVLAAVRSAVWEGIRIEEALSAVSAYPAPSVRAALFHLLWRQEFSVDMTQRLTTASVLRTAS
ncbi:TnsA-like heteromeric transposase endonuclease subunit [Rhodococcus qingshengii]|uniref:TnsA-like heteromeric transposase endonuclease subunit n=3 Tax=Actinomycetes TaxID=1760 RepID=A0ABV5XHJ9_9NOCA|nr:TnsA-like heteromeric transposase endonuclease subunit [Rhodococcus qingshengii]EEN84890.1 hypothetical protein RHOER0001_6665 [Rhodococcus erythropolis SK121]MCZ4547985.1 TnsA-like heteromeric transposase endonuclease subunit [Rhodococcus qingshengii]UGQ55691.1 TnsA-like heteromeric transposase endonuclease subunit [Rhodococcus qingshengii]